MSSQRKPITRACRDERRKGIPDTHTLSTQSKRDQGARYLVTSKIGATSIIGAVEQSFGVAVTTRTGQ